MPCAFVMQIFGIYMLAPGSAGSTEDVLQPGTKMVAAGYCMYGSSCTVSARHLLGCGAGYTATGTRQHST